MNGRDRLHRHVETVFKVRSKRLHFSRGGAGTGGERDIVDESVPWPRW